MSCMTARIKYRDPIQFFAYYTEQILFDSKLNFCAEFDCGKRIISNDQIMNSFSMKNFTCVSHPVFSTASFQLTGVEP